MINFRRNPLRRASRVGYLYHDTGRGWRSARGHIFGAAASPSGATAGWATTEWTGRRCGLFETMVPHHDTRDQPFESRYSERLLDVSFNRLFIRFGPRKLELRPPENRMNIHHNARLTPLGRERMVRAIVEGGAAPRAAGVCPRTARKWVDQGRSDSGAADKALRVSSLQPVASRSSKRVRARCRCSGPASALDFNRKRP